MKKLLLLLCTLIHIQSHGFLDIKIDSSAAKLLGEQNYTNQIGKALSYSGIACILIPLVTRATAKLIREAKGNQKNLSPLENQSDGDCNRWKNIGNYTKLGAKLIMSGLGVYTSGLFMQAILMRYASHQINFW